jgi:predicted nucleic acid-binding protein
MEYPMTLVDANALVAAIDRTERDHLRVRDALRGIRGHLVTTWPAFTEATYLLGRSLGWPGQQALWAFLRRSALTIAPAGGDMTNPMLQRIADLMERYKDAPMDLADASLVALAEEAGVNRILTLDRHFEAVYRLHRRRRFQVLP